MVTSNRGGQGRRSTLQPVDPCWRCGTSDHKNEVVSMASLLEIGDSESFTAGDQIVNIINKLNGTPRSADSAESIRELLFECVQAGGGNARVNMALYFAMKRGLGFGMQREAIDEAIEESRLLAPMAFCRGPHRRSEPRRRAADLHDIVNLTDGERALIHGGKDLTGLTALYAQL